ncbi:hypothetical protein BJ170DRAFT_717697 [Xylariales sp. AK1849]|nr:hypothetical protein BJ170DRAFT_717697 [Xylariales sp. AK1849]
METNEKHLPCPKVHPKPPEISERRVGQDNSFQRKSFTPPWRQSLSGMRWQNFSYRELGWQSNCKTEPLLCNESEGLLGSCVTLADVNGRPQRLIRIFRKASGSQVSFQGLLGTVIHEMIHAYIAAFLCRRRTCYQDHLSTCGLTGRGPGFRAILYAATTVISRLDAYIKATFDQTNECNYKPFIDQERGALARRVSERNNLWIDKDVLLSIPTEPDSASLIRVCDFHVEIDERKLRYRAVRRFLLAAQQTTILNEGVETLQVADPGRRKKRDREGDAGGGEDHRGNKYQRRTRDKKCTKGAGPLSIAELTGSCFTL